MSIGDSVHSAKPNEYVGNKPASIAMGIVAENWNSEHPGMVKVNILISEKKESLSDWMPVATPYAANGTGLYLLPEVGSTVIVAYVDDSSVTPVVIGSIWYSGGKSKFKMPQNTADKDNSIKVFTTPGGHSIKLNEGKDNPSLEIITNKKQRIFLDDKEEKMTLTSGGDDTGIIIDGKSGNIEIKAKNSVSIKAGSKEALKATKTDATLKADKLTIDGSQLQIKGKQTKIEGTTVDISAQGNLKAESSGMAQIKGSMLKLN